MGPEEFKMLMIKTQLRYTLKELTDKEIAFLSTLGITDHDSWSTVYVSDKEYITYYRLFREIDDIREVLI